MKPWYTGKRKYDILDIKYNNFIFRGCSLFTFSLLNTTTFREPFTVTSISQAPVLAS